MFSPFYRQFVFCYKKKLTPLSLLRLALIIISSFVSVNTFANDVQLKFDSLTTFDGLSHSNVFSIVQDKRGYIWIATEDGLNRYDGKSFVQYRHQANNPSSLIANGTRKVFIDNADIIWIGTDNGLSKYNSELDSFENYENIANNKKSLKDNVIWDIYQDNNENIWVSTELGLHQFDSENNNFKRVRVRGYEDQLKEVKTIYQDNKNNYWFGTYDKGIIIANSDLSYAVSLKEQNKWGLSIDAKSLFDIRVIENDYWLATDNGIFIISSDYILKKHMSQQSENFPIAENRIRAVFKVDNAHVWLASEQGLISINLKNYHSKSYRNSSKEIGISENWLMDIFKDDNGKVWLATYGGGINVFSPFSTNFSQLTNTFDNNNFRISSIAQNKDLEILLSTEQNGLFLYNKNKQIKKISLNIEENITNLLIDNNQTLWLRTESNKLYSIINDNFSIKEIPSWFEESQYSIYDKLFLINNTIFFININGVLTAYDTLLDTYRHFPTNNKIKLSALGKENNNFLWAKTQSHQIVRFDIGTQIFSQFETNLSASYNLDKNKSIAVSKNWIWLGTISQGIYLINRTTNKISLFDESNQLKNNYIADILIDDDENAWLSTNKGISVIIPSILTVKNFDKDFEIKNVEFLGATSLLSKSKEMYFGSSNGAFKFSPQDVLNIKQFIAPPIFTDILIANKKVKIKPVENNNLKHEFSLRKQINFIEKLTLVHDQSPFSIEFISPNPRLPSQINYRYKLLGLEDNWIETNQSNLRATYTNLSAGDYVFKVQVYDNAFPELTKTKSLNIHVMPPWWLSKIALLIYSLLSLAFLSYIVQQMRRKRQYHLQIQQSEERLKLSLWGSGDEMWDWNIITGKIFRSNIWGILEFPQDGTRNVGHDKTNLHHHDIPRVQKALSDHFDNKTEHFESTYRVKDKHDRWIWVLDRGKIVERDEQNKPTRMTGTLKDISQIKKAEERLKLFAKCIENISDAVVIYDRQFVIVDINKSFQRITGKNKSLMIGKSLSFNRYPEIFTQKVKKHLITNGSWHGEIESERDNGKLYLTDLNIDVIRDDNKKVSHFVGVFSDITKRKETEVELRKLANSDTLTGLPNRSFFQANQSRLVKNKIPHALLVFDLDNFKKINDSLGHQIGDIILCKVANRMLKIGRGDDTVFRLGGDEFSIIIENTNDIHTITTLAKKILQTIAIPLKLKNQEIVLYGSIGIVLYPEDGASPHELLKKADTAMYHAKDAGGNKYQFFNESMNQEAVKRLQIESLIRQGLKDDLFSVFYQPKIEISTGKIAGMEALVRFETPKKGLISPVVFIPVSEETGQIIDIGEVVLRKACFATKRWVDQGLFNGRIAVNLSAVQFTQPNLVSLIASILLESKLDAKYLELEITEGTVMDSPQAAIETMHKIRAMGIHLALDDFGTGYSSLAYLKKFPLNTLKIDKAFVDDIEQSEQGRNMVATIVTIAHNLGMHVVAEGVETSQQLSFLSGLKCEQLQGYLYSKPLPEKNFQKYLLAHQITNKSTVFGQQKN